MLFDTESLTSVKFTTLSQSVSPQNSISSYTPRPKLFNVARGLIAGVSVDNNALNIFLFNVSSRKPLYKKALQQKFEIPIQARLDLVVIHEKDRPDMLVVRSDMKTFQFLNLRLQLLFNLSFPDSFQVPCLCYTNKRIITWFNGDLRLSYWHLFESKPYQTLDLPFRVRECHSLLPNRNLLILLSSDESQLIFIDTSKSQVINTAKSPGNLLHRVINSEDRVVTSWFSFADGECLMELYCQLLTPEMELKTLGEIQVTGHGRTILPLCGSVFLKLTNEGVYMVEIGTEKMKSQKLERPSDEKYDSCVEMEKYEKMVCVLTRANRLLLLQIKQNE